MTSSQNKTYLNKQVVIYVRTYLYIFKLANRVLKFFWKVLSYRPKFYKILPEKNVEHVYQYMISFDFFLFCVKWSQNYLVLTNETAGWHRWLNGCESEWTPGVGDGQGGLACCDSWGRKELDTTDRLIWSDLNGIWGNFL